MNEATYEIDMSASKISQSSTNSANFEITMKTKDIDTTLFIPCAVKGLKGDKGDKGDDGGIVYTAGDNIDIDDNNVISVITTDDAEGDNTRPITSSGVYSIVGNIDVLLSKI